MLASPAVRATLFGLIAVSLAVRPAAATPYETFVDVSDQSDLEDLLASGDITSDTYSELLELIEVGLDLATADRAQLYALPNLTYDDVDAIIAYREKQNGIIRDPAELVTAGALSEDKLLAIAAFVVVKPRDTKLAVRGWLRAMTRWSLLDDTAPPFALRGRFTLQKDWTAGFAAVFTRNGIGDPVYDPNRGALIADRPNYGVDLAKLYVKYETDKLSAVVGTFRAGFAQRLVFDNSSHYTPNGLYLDDDLYYTGELERECRESAGELETSPCTGAAGRRYITPDWSWREGMFGAGVGAKHLELGVGWLQAYAWASSANKSVYQYELFDRRTCDDPHDDSPGCEAPTVYVTPDGSLLEPTSRHSFQTLPDVFVERLVGANATFYADRRNSIGVVAYGAQLTNLLDGVDLDTQEWSRLPTGRRYGAAGAHFSLGKSWLDVFGEAAVSFDWLPDGPGGGGAAGLLRVTATKKGQELEATLRAYGVDYANPYARPISQGDEFEGQRARDEVGARLRYLFSNKLWQLRASVDLWSPLTSFGDDAVLGRSQPKLDSYVRGDVKTTDQLRLGLWLRYQDRDLRDGGHAQCFEVSIEETETGETVPCSGRQLTTSARARFAPDKRMTYTAMLEHQFVDDGLGSTSRFSDRYRQDMSGWLIGLWRPTQKLRLRGRVRYLHEAINNADGDYLERSFAGLVDAGIVVRGRDTLRVRGDVKWYLDERSSTETREPNPELQLWLSYEARL